MCSACGVSKSLEFFGRDSSAKDRLNARCKPCANQLAKEYYDKNKNVIKDKNLKRYHSDKNRAKEYYQANKLRIKKYAGEYYKENKPDFIRRINKRRAVRKNLPHQKYTEQDIFNRWGTDCHICGGSVDLLAPRKAGTPGWELGLHLDHVISLSDGGPDIVENVRPAHGVCNLRKH